MNRRYILTLDLSNLSIWFFFFIKLRTFTFSLKWDTLQLLFGMSELPASLLLCFGAIIKEMRMTWRQVLWSWDSQSDNGEGYWVPSRQDPLDKGMIHILDGTQQDSKRFHQATQSIIECKLYELFTSRTFPLIFSDRGRPQVIGTADSKTANGGRGTVLWGKCLKRLLYWEAFSVKNKFGDQQSSPVLLML